jgi:cytoskeletal protein RodZ
MPGKEVQELGQILHQARLHKGVSLMEAQQATKIRQSFLAALEEDDYSILPPPIYVRGFIKNYSTYLGLDGQEMVQLFDELLESVAAGYDPYNSSYGSSDSGGQQLQTSINPQMLAGLSQGEARLVERGSEMINLTSFSQSDDAETPAPIPNEAEDKTATEKPKVGLGSANSGKPRRSSRRLDGLRVPEKYILRPAIQPINKPSFYLPSFVPLLLVLIILGAAFLIVYRGLAVPIVKDQSDLPTATPNVYSRATVTPLAASEVGEGQPTPTRIASVVTTVGATPVVGNTPPPFYTPDQALVAPSAPPKANAPGTSTPVTTTQPIKVEVTASGGPSWLTVTVDGQEKYAQNLAVGEIVGFEGKRIMIRAGAPGNVRVKVNGQDKQYAPPGSDVINHTWDANGEDSITK